MSEPPRRSTWDVRPEHMRGLRPYIPGLGATIAFQSDYPGVFDSIGIHPREASRNVYRGLTVSQPDPGRVYYGFTYDDLKDGRTDEDIYVLDTERKEITHHGSVEKVDSRYKDTHHGDKSHLS